MNPLFRTFAVGALALSFCGGTAIAQDHHDDQEHRDQDHHDQYVRHDDWKRGQHIRHEDWDRGQRVDDWQSRHLTRPRKGYEWRDIDGQYVMANSDGVIYRVVGPGPR
jgi:Ni/Co efflux regulator RcnB